MLPLRQIDSRLPAVRTQPVLWLFDLDNTLHDASRTIFPNISARMNDYMARVLGRDGEPATPEAVNAARLMYWKRYGATLLGMIRHHGVDPAHFLHETHDFTELERMLHYERGLSLFMRRLPGRKILLTNAPARYSRQVLRHLGLQRRFSHHIAIEDMVVRRELRPKPSKALLRRVLRRHGAVASRCVLVEDTLENLRSASQLGMRTVWVTRYLRPHADGSGPRMPKRPAYVDVKVQSVRQLPRHLRALGMTLQP